MRRKNREDKSKSDYVRPKKKRRYPTRKNVKDSLRDWESADWEKFGSDTIEGNNDARNDD